MASVLRGSARTTPRIRAELQASKESARSLPARYDLNPKTVRKWRQRTTTADAPMGPKAPKSTVLTPAEEAVVVAFRQKTLLPLDDVLGCLREHSQSQPKRPAPLPPAAWDLQAAEGEASDKRNRFKSYQIGYGALSRELSLAVRNLQFPVRAQAAVAARHVRNASSRRTRSVWREVRWRWTLNVL